MPAYRLLPLLLVPLLAGCLQNRVEEIGVGHYRLNAKYSTRAGLQAALADQQRRADELCPTGWFKRKDYDRRDGASRILVWEIGCDRQYRPEHRQQKTP